jgi:hypothetical protein
MSRLCAAHGWRGWVGYHVCVGVGAESMEFQAAKAEVANMPDGMLLELRSLYHTEETPLFIVRTFGAVG